MYLDWSQVVVKESCSDQARGLYMYLNSALASQRQGVSKMHLHMKIVAY